MLRQQKPLQNLLMDLLHKKIIPHIQYYRNMKENSSGLHKVVYLLRFQNLFFCKNQGENFSALRAESNTLVSGS